MRFTTRSLLTVTALSALALACWKVESPAFLRALGAAVAANLTGVGAALFVTNVLGLPNDGSFKGEYEA